MAVQIQLRNDTTVNWSNANPILALGEFGLDTDLNQFKIGNGIDPWNELSYGSFNPVPFVTQSVQTITYNSGGDSTMDNGTYNVFSLVADGSSTTIAHSNVPESGIRYAFELHLTWTSGSITWPSSWYISSPNNPRGDTPPSSFGDYVITGVTIDGGLSWKIAVLAE